MIIVDSREKKWDHIEKVFSDQKILYDVKKLDVGDYFNTDRPALVIDRKRNLDECAQNLYTKKDSSRFWRELRRASEQKIKLIILVEYGNAKSIEDIKDWKSKYNPYATGRRLADEMFRCHIAYQIDWVFCKSSDTAKRILEILEYEG